MHQSDPAFSHSLTGNRAFQEPCTPVEQKSPSATGNVEVRSNPGEKVSHHGGPFAGSTQSPPVQFQDHLPLCGSQWQIRLALQRAGILTSNKPKELTNKLKKKVVLWGQCAGRDYYVYVNSQKYSGERIERARSELEQIRALPYHPVDHELPRGYSNLKDFPLEASSEEALAKVLYEVGILKSPFISDLHATLKNKRGGLFGMVRDDKSMFRLYLHKKHSTKLEKALQILKSTG